MSSVTWIIIGILAYALFMVFHGFSNFKQTSKSAESFFNADRGVSPFVLICTTAISVYSGLSYYGYPSSIYKFGIGYFAGCGCAITAFMFCIVGYRLWILGREYGFQTPSDFLRERYYSEGFGLFTAILLVAFIIPYVALQLITIGNGIVVTTNGAFPYLAAVALGTVCVSLHIIGGGMKSVAWLDTFHMILGFAAVYLVLIFLVIKMFPDGGLVEAARTVMSNPKTASILSTPGPEGAYNWKGILNLSLTGAVATIVWPHIFMRCYIAKDLTNFKVMSWAMPLIYASVFIGLAIIGCLVAPAILGDSFADPDSIMPTLASQYCPPIIAFISLLCLFAFAVSTSDSMLLSASAMASRDIYTRHKYELKGQTVEPKKVVTFGRVVLLILMVAVLVITALKPTYITDYAYRLSSPFFAMILPATIGGLFWKRGSKEGAIVGTVAGVVVVVLLTFFITPPFGFSALLWGLVVNAVLYIAVSLCTKVPDEIVNKYITKVSNTITAGAEVRSISEKATKEALAAELK
ncbi:MAG: sodium:solute symporter family protein [Firmicutes bacterium]|nr:sodium:solute symporter family protein [Bacillota bacterium]